MTVERPIAEETIFSKNRRKRIKKIISIIRTSVELYIALKKKDILYSGLVLTSLYDSLDQIIDNKEEEPEYFLIKNNKKERGMISVFVYQVLQELGIRKTTICRGEYNGGSYEIEKYKIVKEDVFFKKTLYSNTLYYNPKGNFIKELSVVFSEKYDKNIVLSLDYDNSSNLILTINPLKKDTSNYKSIVNDSLYYDNILKIREKGLNRSSLLLGEPGSGKTTFALKIAQKMNGRLVCIEPSALDYIISNCMPIIDIVKILSPSIVLFDDLDRLEVGYLDKLLSISESLNDFDERIVIMGSINNINKLPDALCRPGRFDEILLFDYPKYSLRKDIIKTYLDVFGTRLCNNNLEKMIKLSEGFSPAYLKEFALQASIHDFEKIPDIINNVRLMKNSKNKKNVDGD